MKLHIIFMGTPEFAVPTLAALLEAGHEVVAVYSQPPRPAGRGMKEQPSPVHLYARARGINVHTPVSLKGAEEQRQFAALGADAAVVAAYGLLLPKPILEAPKFGCLNVHPSLLPRWRGAAPIPRTILAGDAETAMCIMRMDEGLDTGPILLCEKMALNGTETAGELHDRMAVLGGRLMAQALEGVAAGTLAAQPQAAERATYAKKLEKAEARLDWRKPAAELERQVRGFNPWPGAFFEANGENIKVWKAEVIERHSLDLPLADPKGIQESMDHPRIACGDSGEDGFQPGTVLDDKLTIACGEGALRILELQRPGKKPMPAREALLGWRLPMGSVLPASS